MRRKKTAMFLAVLLMTVLAAVFIICRHFGKEDADMQTNRTKKGMEYQAELAEAVSVDNGAISEDEYGERMLTAVVTMPDYSALFHLCREDAEADAKDFKEFEERLLELARDYEKTEAAGEIETISREICISPLDSGVRLDSDGSLSEEAVRLAAMEAVKEELREFAMDIMMEYTLQVMDFSEEAEGEDGQ